MGTTAPACAVTPHHQKTVGAGMKLGQDIGMMCDMAKSVRRLLLLAALAVALVATGFANRVPATGDDAVLAYVLAGGTLSDICGDADGDGLPDHGDCPACHIVGAAALPSADLGLRDADLIFVAAIVAPRESRAVRAVLDPARGLRAPPLA